MEVSGQPVTFELF